MNYERVIERWVKYGKARGLKDSVIEAPADWIFRKMGFKFAPMVLWGFPSVALLMGGAFGVMFGMVQLYFGLHDGDFANSMVGIAGAGAFYGTFMAVFHSWNKRRLKLPSWSEFQEMTTDQLNL